MHENSPPQWLRLAAGRRGLTAAAAVLACGAIGLAAGPAAQAATRPAAPAAAQPAQLEGVSANSASDAWAVGYTDNSSDVPSSLILRWAGKSWATVTSPDPGGKNGTSLAAVSAVNASDAWAVGTYVNSAGTQATLILHWNGTKWAQVTSPDPGSGSTKFDELKAVSAVSATSAWAVGYDVDTDGDAQTLALHWNGTSWTQVATPNPAGASALNQLSGVSTVSASDAWAVGAYYSSTGEDTPLTLHWNGKTWAKVSSPSISGVEGAYLSGVSARTGSDIWAAGSAYTISENESVVLHSNGTTWTRDTTPNPGGSDGNTNLYGTSADAASNAWAVGDYTPSETVQATLALRWNGTKWAQVSTPNPAGTTVNSGAINDLKAVSALTASDAWAVGYFSTSSGPDQTLILHWSGTSWTHVTSPN
jgi:hypothetical protein